MRYAGLLLLCLLAACATGNKRLDALPYAQDKVDGSYRGWAWLTSAPDLKPHRWWQVSHYDSAKCPHTGFGVFEIADRTLNYSYNPHTLFQVPVGADGSLNQVVGQSTLRGSVKNNRLIIEVRTPVCTVRFDGRFYLNHS